VSSLDGAYVTAGDVGISVADLDVISETCRWTTGRSPAKGGLGDSAILTAVGVLAGMRASTTVALGRDTFEGLSVAIVGLGKVGGRLAEHLTDAGADVIGFDPDADARARIADTCPGIRLADSLEEVLAAEVDVLSPNALGGLITADLAEATPARVICGAANNQLASPGIANVLAARGVTYAPDFLVNPGGVIQIAQEFVGGTLEQARVQAEGVFATTLRVLERAASEGVTPVTAAEQEAEDRIRHRRAALGQVV
jgi:valine dehydrogenase (NAD+)